MEIKRCRKESFSVSGKEGSTRDGAGFVKKLWEEANGHFKEISHLAQKDENGVAAGIWGAMTDFSRTFQPWEENFSQGLYLAGVEVVEGAVPPEGWTIWTIPGYEYLYVKCTGEETFSMVLDYMKENHLELAGAVLEFFCPEEEGQQYLFFPIGRLTDCP